MSQNGRKPRWDGDISMSSQTTDSDFTFSIIKVHRKYRNTSNHFHVTLSGLTLQLILDWIMVWVVIPPQSYFCSSSTRRCRTSVLWMRRMRSSRIQYPAVAYPAFHHIQTRVWTDELLTYVLRVSAANQFVCWVSFTLFWRGFLHLSCSRDDVLTRSLMVKRTTLSRTPGKCRSSMGTILLNLAALSYSCIHCLLYFGCFNVGKNRQQSQ